MKLTHLSDGLYLHEIPMKLLHQFVAPSMKCQLFLYFNIYIEITDSRCIISLMWNIIAIFQNIILMTLCPFISNTKKNGMNVRIFKCKVHLKHSYLPQLKLKNSFLMACTRFSSKQLYKVGKQRTLFLSPGHIQFVFKCNVCSVTKKQTKPCLIIVGKSFPGDWVKRRKWFQIPTW